MAYNVCITGIPVISTITGVPVISKLCENLLTNSDFTCINIVLFYLPQYVKEHYSVF